MNEAVQACLVIAANLCINGQATIESNDGGMWAGARIRLADAMIVSTVRTDNFPYPDRRLMNKHCKNRSECIYYHKHCSESANGVKCVISYNRDRDEYNKSIEISGSDREQVASAMGKLSLTLPTLPGLVPLLELSVESKGAIPPYCRPKKEPECASHPDH